MLTGRWPVYTRGKATAMFGIGLFELLVLAAMLGVPVVIALVIIARSMSNRNDDEKL